MKGVIPIINLFAGKLIIDEVVSLAHKSSHHQPLNYGTLFGYIALEMAAFLTYTALDRIGNLLDSLITDKYINDYSVKLMVTMATMDMERLEDSDVQDELERIRRQINSKNILFPQLAGQLQNLVTTIGFATSLVIYTPWLILALMLSLVPSFLSELRFDAKSYDIGKAFTSERRQQDYIRGLGIGIPALKEVRTFSLLPFLISRYSAISNLLYETNKAILIKRTCWSVALSIFGSLGYYAAYIIIAFRAVRGEFSIGDLAFLTGSFRRVKFLLEGFLFSTSQLFIQAQHASDATNFFKNVNPNHGKSAPIPVPPVIKEGFLFEGVGFRYEGSERWILRDVSFSFRPGETLAIVGLNGAGKTTLIKLLARLYSPTEGTIYLDGVPIENYEIESFRKKISIIFQDYIKYAFTASENIGVGNTAELNNIEKITSAAEKSSASSMIDGLPERYQQKLGKLEKSGVELSGGQWQKLAIARAFMREASFMILDEPSSALDADSEEKIFNRIINEKASTGIMLVSHRLSTVRRAKKIIVLEHGEVTEVGTHQDLIKLDGAYARLFKLQAAAYA